MVEIQEVVEEIPEDVDLLQDPKQVGETISASSQRLSELDIDLGFSTDAEQSLGE